MVDGWVESCFFFSSFVLNYNTWLSVVIDIHLYSIVKQKHPWVLKVNQVVGWVTLFSKFSYSESFF